MVVPLKAVVEFGVDFRVPIQGQNLFCNSQVGMAEVSDLKLASAAI